MTLTEEDKSWILDAIRGKQSENSRPNYNGATQSYGRGQQPRTPSKGPIDQVTKTGEHLLVGGVRLAGLALSVIARTTQVTTRALAAGVDVYVGELEDAMNRSGRSNPAQIQKETQVDRRWPLS